MWWMLQMFFVTVATREVYNEKIGYFWHVTDLHYDGQVNAHGSKGCWRPDYDGSQGKSSRKPTGRYGDYNCDSTWELIESAARTMMSRQNENVEFVLWTGDGLSHHHMRHLSESRQLEVIKNITDLFSRTFKSQFVFPAIGHDDPNLRRKLSAMWSRWLPSDSKRTFEEGGYYIIERKMLKLQIVVLNTNLMKRQENDAEAKEQWIWLNYRFKKFQERGETVYIVGHMPPGSNERQKVHHNSNHVTYSGHHNKKYLNLVRKFARIIVGQFFGHLHSDTFRVIYEENRGLPVSWAMISPSVTSRRNNQGPNNPGLRLYKFDWDTGQVFDYTQYYLDLSKVNANSNQNVEWVVEYNFSTYYSFNEINAGNLHTLAERLTRNYPMENSVFNRYYKANSVRINNNANDCDSNCAHIHYCAITRVDYSEFHQCLQTPPNTLSKSASSAPQMVFLMSIVTNSVVLVKWQT